MVGGALVLEPRGGLVESREEGTELLARCLAVGVEAFDVETGRTRLLSRREARGLQSRVQTWQDEVAALARKADLDVLRLGRDQTKFDIALLEWVHERRLRRK